MSGIELSTQTRDGYYVERVITTACEGVFKDVVRAREIETLLAGLTVLESPPLVDIPPPRTSSGRDVMTDLDRVHTILHFIRLPLFPYTRVLLKSDFSDRRRLLYCLLRLGAPGLGEVRSGNGLEGVV